MSRRRGPRIKRDCQHPKARHEHGTAQAYISDACRCEPCTDAASAKSLRYERQLVYGRRKPIAWVDATTARQHVTRLRSDGYALHLIATTAGLDLSKVTRLIYGLPSANQPPTPQIREADRDALMAVRLTWHDLPENALTPAIGSQRRLQALACLGWPTNRVAKRIGTTQSHLSGISHRKRITAGMARSIAAVYDELSMTPAPDGPYARRLRNHADSKGWAPPLAWDDDTIDNPKAKPQGHALAA